MYWSSTISDRRRRYIRLMYTSCMQCPSSDNWWVHALDDETAHTSRRDQPRRETTRSRNKTTEHARHAESIDIIIKTSFWWLLKTVSLFSICAHALHMFIESFTSLLESEKNNALRQCYTLHCTSNMGAKSSNAVRNDWDRHSNGNRHKAQNRVRYTLIYRIH